MVLRSVFNQWRKPWLCVREQPSRGRVGILDIQEKIRRKKSSLTPTDEKNFLG